MEDPIDEIAVTNLCDRLASARQNSGATTNEDGNEQLISVSTTLEYGAQISDEESNIYGLVTLQAPLSVLPADGELITSSHVPIDLVCVVDQSGSMAGEKMNLLKETLIYITEQMNDLDRLGIVSFDTQAFNRSNGLKRMNTTNQEMLKKEIDRISDGGGTFIGCGLQMGINLLNSRQTTNPLSALFLLTDGQDNEQHDYSQLMKTLPQGVLCHTFGYGPDHTASLLVQLADQGNGGTFTYIDQAAAVGPAFAMTLGGLFTCIAQQLRVNIQLNGSYKMTHTHSKYSHEPQQLPSNKLTWKLTDLNADEKRNLIFQLHVPKMDVQQNTHHDHTIGQVTLTYLQPNSNQTITTIPVFFQLIRATEPPADLLKVNYALDIQRNRVETAREIKRAMDENNYQKSIAILNGQIEKIKSSVSAEDPFCQTLIKDLQCRFPSERDYRASHTNNYMQHYAERGTYAPSGNISPIVYQQQSQQQQVAHFIQQQSPYQQYPPAYSQQQQPPPYVQPQQQQTTGKKSLWSLFRRDSQNK